MNTLDDLRSTLDQHSRDAAGLDPVTRRAQLGERIATSRRRRHAVRSGLVVASVAAVAGAVALPTLVGEDTVRPAGRTVLGQEAPAQLSTYDNVYRFLEAVESPRASTLEVEVEGADQTRVLTWATAGDDQDVRVDGPFDERWDSSRADFDDWVTIPEGFEGTVTVTSTSGADGLAAALYEADPSDLPGVVEAFHGQYFRAEGPTTRRAGVGVGEPGETELRVPYRDVGRHLSIEISCAGLPPGLVMEAVTDSGAVERSTDACQGDSVARRGSSLSLTKDLGLRPGTRTTTAKGDWPDGEVLVRVTRRDGTPVDPADHAEARLAAAVYGTPGKMRTVPGTDHEVETMVWMQGHLWRLDRVVPGAANQPQDVSEDAADAPVLANVLTHSPDGSGLTASVLVDGEQAGETAFVDSKGGTSGQPLVVPKGTRVVQPQAERARRGDRVDPDVQTMVLYRLVP